MTRTDASPRRRLDPDSRRAAIVAAAAQEFSRAPYAQVTITQVAARAGASEALLYRYFAGKDDLYATVVRHTVADLAARQEAAVAALRPGVPRRDRVRAVTLVQLDDVAAHPHAWAGAVLRPGDEPAVVAQVRRQARAEQATRLRDLLADRVDRRFEYALWGYLGFLESACARWAEQGCPPEDRWPLVEAALGALQGALGDWGG
ncbi:TetR/AcrR family transcriptional regulator [Xylanimonas ulmi]|uniref:TetR family transcriptional regulator n=1 Tax=Xylanimonas ulmi TaxID=228973 RepID=A0A4Q7M0N7_9MICO|nr:TetR/AcrR family transcriptional regulator [Xylanibacterium ulmi]RZS59908.1 TetR family transcriptional regulator [Xylanibacterium ulmi]